MLEKYGIDTKSGIARFSGNQTLYEKFLKRFLDDKNFEKLQAALETDNIEEAYTAAHTIKGVAGNLSIDSVYNASMPLNEVLKSGDLQTAKILFVDFRKLYDLAIEGIKTAFEDK
jgi:HPt (histidine-containing phosphotransfer) domain-containing protein